MGLFSLLSTATALRKNGRVTNIRRERRGVMLLYAHGAAIKQWRCCSRGGGMGAVKRSTRAAQEGRISHELAPPLARRSTRQCRRVIAST